MRADVALLVSPAHLTLSIHQALIQVPLVPSLFTPDTGNTLWPALDKLNKKGGGNSNFSGLET